MEGSRTLRRALRHGQKLDNPPHPNADPGAPGNHASEARARGKQQAPSHLGSFLGQGQHSAVSAGDCARLTLLALEQQAAGASGRPAGGEGPTPTTAEPPLGARTNTPAQHGSRPALLGALWLGVSVGPPWVTVTERRIPVRTCRRLWVGQGGSQVPLWRVITWVAWDCPSGSHRGASLSRRH